MTQADSQTFRHVIGHFASGVTVLTTHKDGADFGATASAMSSLSLDPPMLLVCLNTRSITQEAIHATRRLGVNILGEDQGVVAERFASARGANKFAGMDIERGGGGVPLLADSLAFCECQIVEDVVAGTHRVFLANVTRAVAHDGTPLTYFRGKFGRFETQQDRVVYGELRSRILTRLISLEASLDIGVLAKDFDVLPATVYQAVTKLAADGLLGRDPDRGYVVKPVTPESSDDAFDARAAMELGVAATTVGKVSKARVQAITQVDGGSGAVRVRRPLPRRRCLHQTQRSLPQRDRRPRGQPDSERRLPTARCGRSDGVVASGGFRGRPGDAGRSPRHRDAPTRRAISPKPSG